MSAPATCSVCGRTFERGGRKGPKPLCPAHYFRERRGSTRAADPSLGQRKLPPMKARVKILAEALVLLQKRGGLPADALVIIGDALTEVGHAS